MPAPFKLCIQGNIHDDDDDDDNDGDDDGDDDDYDYDDDDDDDDDDDFDDDDDDDDDVTIACRESRPERMLLSSQPYFLSDWNLPQARRKQPVSQS